MKITFLIGNGFDVNLGIESSYGKFYEWYYKQKSELDHISAFKKDIQEDMVRDVPADEKTWSDFESGLGQYTTRFTAENVSDFLDCYDDAQSGIVKYLLSQENTVDFKNISDKELKKFMDSMVNFFQDVSDQEKISINESLNNLKSEDREISVISYNYTSSFERIIAHISSNPLATWVYSGNRYSWKLNHNIIHVHGTTSEFPIIGVNDDSQIANKALLNTPQFRDVLVKTECVNALGRLWHRQAEEQISQSRFVCVFGMSLGKTDAKWWRKLVEWLKSNSNRHLIIYWYEKNPPNGISTRKQLECENKVKNLLMSYTKMQEAEAEPVKRRIHVVVNTSKFLNIHLGKQVAITSPQNSTEYALI